MAHAAFFGYQCDIWRVNQICNVPDIVGKADAGVYKYLSSEKLAERIEEAALAAVK